MSKRKVRQQIWMLYYYDHFIALSQSLILNYSSLKLNRLVTEKWVDGWDDPRLMTLAGLRRRGMTSTAINSFVRGIGITRR
jgi:glutamyl/glutaminyl-tRNA synthetase